MIKRIILFMGTNGVGTLVDTFVLWIFSTFIFHKYTGVYIISPIISFEFAVLSNYICSYYVIWRKRIDNKCRKDFLKRYIAYNLTCSGTFLFKMGILLLAEHFFNWHVVVCNLFALCFSGTVNYVMGEWVIFRKKKNIEEEIKEFELEEEIADLEEE